ncbi:MAG: SpoIIE family protein phosphatase [Candidatus Omnitrophica bacterium]|nr:SpoIIE family protein phosphatase [Candidatus Omnitrophota bacterium]
MDLLLLKIRAAGLYICAFFNLLIAVFIWSKDIKNKANLHLGFVGFFSAIYSFVCGSVYFFWNANSPTQFNLMIYRSTYLGVFLIAAFVPFVYYFVGNVKNIGYKIFFLYFGAALLSGASFVSPYIFTGVYLAYPHIGGIAGKYDIFGRVYILGGLTLGLYVLFKEYFKSGGIRREKIKYFVIGTLLYAVSGIIFTSIVPFFTGKSVYYDFAAYFSLCWTILTVYAIIRYRFLEIETVIHKTVLWLLSILLLIFPLSAVAFFALEKCISVLPTIFNIILINVIFLIFHYYYALLRPQIDHVFRRRKYDYIQVLGQISQQISGLIDLDALSQKVILGIKETIYPQNIHLFLRNEEEGWYYLKSYVIGNSYKTLVEKDPSGAISTSLRVFRKLTETKQPVEKQLLGLDPAYDDVKEEALELFDNTDSVLMFGLIFENEILGLIFLGRRENLKDYTRLDINALNNLIVNITGSFYTSLHHHDILEKERMQQELLLAKNIQTTLLPHGSPQFPGIRLCGLYMPSKEIGGDYYDFIIQDEKAEKKLYITIADVSGKGLDAGLVMVILKSSIYSLAKSFSSPLPIIAELNKFLCTQLKQQKFVSMLLLRYLSTAPDEIVYSSAGHEHILIYRVAAAGEGARADIEVVRSGGLIIGMVDPIAHFLNEEKIKLRKGDKVILYTDGATEARNPEFEMFGLPSLINSFKSHAHLPIQDVIQNIRQDIKDFISAAEQYDDITLVGIEKE